MTSQQTQLPTQYHGVSIHGQTPRFAGGTERITIPGGLLLGVQRVEMIDPIKIVMADESCGMGRLLATGRARVHGRAYPTQEEMTVEVRPVTTAGEWRNFGAPHGTRYDWTGRWVPVDAE